MADIGVSGAKLEIGRVVSRTLEGIRSNLTPLLILAAIYGAPAFLLQFLISSMRTNPGIAVFVFLVGLLVFVIGIVVGAALIQGSAATLDGQRPGVGEMVQAGLGRALPYLGLMICMYIGVFLGMILLVVPGVILAVTWSVAPTVVVIERKGVFESLSRSAALTKGSRWTLFAILLVFGLAFFVASLLLGFIIGLVFGLVGAIVVGSALASTVVSVAGLLIGVMGAVVIYTELRGIKEGATPGVMASVFD